MLYCNFQTIGQEKPNSLESGPAISDALRIAGLSFTFRFTPRSTKNLDDWKLIGD